MNSSKNLILVTGGAGYIGSVLVKELLERNYRVRVFDKLYFDAHSLNELNGHNNLEIIQGDVRNFDESILDGVTGVIHLGSLSNDPTAEFDPKANHEINFSGTKRLVEACKRKGIKKFTFASTCAITGFHLEGIADENFPANPQSEYAQSKLDAEKELIKLADENFCPVILRQATVFGFSQRMRWDLVVNTMTKDAYEKGRIYVYHGGDMWRPLVSVIDVARAHIHCLEAPQEKIRGEIFHVVHKNYRILELAHWIKEILKPLKQIEVDVMFATQEVRSYRVSGEKIKKVLGFTAETTVESAVLEIFNILRSGRYTDFSNPIYYNIDWMKLLVEMEERLRRIGKVL